ncbi:ABC transporter ATP-binding protein [Mycoplasma sp. 'Moose RK']|uniref:ATP-binding cassette domain-containing protein n=1 Tax=Mycoplasma sp. 'Moose RK' TaxID=2780095 RepID=UPI0018C21B81|nr:ABC transporter ATP-binding protein [Mycoplasma sp. 'Moose RK']MBG0731088.1 ABC transporter ATP-binding protein [Mycoplasma sp. 'Moose RK']
MKKDKIAILIKNLSFSYDCKNYLEINDLEIPANQIITILGPSGAGKSTFLNLLAGFLPAKSQIEYQENFKNFGYIMQKDNLYEEISVKKNLWISTKNSPKWTEKVWFLSLEKLKNQKNINSLVEKSKKFFANNKKGFWQKICQKFHFFLTIILNLKFYFFYLKFRKKFFESEVQKVLKTLEITEVFGKKAANISGGQQQRIAFAKSIIKGDNLILMDEPFSSLDAKIKESTIKLLLKIKHEFNMTIILVTHDQVDALKISDQIILLKDGKIVQFSTPQELFDNPKSLFAAKFIGSPEINFLEKKQEISYFIRDKNIKILPTNNEKNGKILFSKKIADSYYYQVRDLEKQIDLELFLPKQILGTDVKIEYDKVKILAFDERGNRVFAEN